MLSSVNRLIDPRKYTRIQKTGSRLRTSWGSVIWEKTEPKSHPQYMIVATKSVSKKATMRNKTKRRIRNLVQNEINNSNPKWTGIIIANREVEYEELLSEIKRVFSTIEQSLS